MERERGRPRQNRKEAGVQTGWGLQETQVQGPPTPDTSKWLPLSGLQCLHVEMGLAAGCGRSEAWCHETWEAEKGSTGVLGELSAVEAPFRPSPLGPRKFSCFSSLSDEQSPPMPLNRHSLTMAGLRPWPDTRASAFGSLRACPGRCPCPG